MGVYINPANETKEDWLEQYGVEIPAPEATDFERVKGEDQLLVCLVQNAAFSAAGICFDQRELADFLRPDLRPRWWYRVPLKELLRVCPQLQRYME